MAIFNMEETIRRTTETVIETLRREGYLKTVDSVHYTEAQKMLREYYRNTPVSGVRDLWSEALRCISDDVYFKIIPLHFKDGKTIEELAEILDCDVSTVSRNKKRLCLKFYDFLKLH